MENLLIFISMKEKVQQKKKKIFNTELEFQAIIYLFFFFSISTTYLIAKVYISQKKNNNTEVTLITCNRKLPIAVPWSSYFRQYTQNTLAHTATFLDRSQ